MSVVTSPPSGGREGEVHLHDVRVAEHRVQTLRGHSQVGNYSHLHQGGMIKQVLNCLFIFAPNVKLD